MKHTKNPPSYPVMLNLQEKKCVIIGGGAVAARKLATLCEAGADVTVVAPAFSPELKSAAGRYSCTLVQQEYRQEQLQQAFIVIAATNSFATNRAVTAAAPLLCNNVTEPELSNFTVPSSFAVDTLTIAVATGGIPGYTKLLKRYLQKKLNPSFGQFNAFLLEQRRRLKEMPGTPAQRTAFWRQVLDEKLIQLLEQENIEQAKEQVQNAVDSFRTQS